MGHYVTGKEAQFIYSSAPEATTVTILDFSSVVFKFSRRMFEVTPEDFEMSRYLPGVLSVSGYVGGGKFLSGSTLSTSLPPPGGDGPPDNVTTGVLAIVLISGKQYTLRAALIELDGSISCLDGGPPQLFQYSFIGNAQTFTDTIVVTG